MKFSLVVATALMLLYSALLGYVPQAREPRFQSGDQQNRHVIEVFMRDPRRAGVVVVGSSMTARLGDAIGDRCAYNLALGGESSVTGVAVLTRSEARPKLVLIETNVPERSINAKLIDQGARLLPRLVPALATRNMPVNLLFDFLSRYKPAPASPGVDVAVLGKALQVQRDLYAHEMAASLLSRNMDTLKQQVRLLEATGIQVVFFEMPIHPALEATPRALQVRGAFMAAFPAHRLITSEELSRGVDIRTIDGVHLAPDEIGPVSQRLRFAYGTACAAPAPARAIEAHSHAAGMSTHG